MEKAMSVEERIRRAEERYNRKIGQTIYKGLENQKEKKDNIKIKRKTRKRLIMQFFIALLIYICFYVGANKEYIFSKEFKEDINSFFTEKTKIYVIYSDAKSYIEKKLLKKEDTKEVIEDKKENEQKDNEKGTGELNEKFENKKIEKNTVEENNNSENVGGAEELNKYIEIIDDIKKEEVAEKKEETQMEKDAKYIKSKLDFIRPIEGRISSTFGWRNPTVKTVPKYHTGLDIAANQGTKIKSMTEGKITKVSEEGDYGKHYYVTYDNINILYAHCSKLYLKEGDIVKQGDEIGEVGSTGNSTGPHLHIGIKLEDRWVDPQLVLNI